MPWKQKIWKSFFFCLRNSIKNSENAPIQVSKGGNFCILCSHFIFFGLKFDYRFLLELAYHGPYFVIKSFLVWKCLEAVARRCSLKKVILKISQENICARASFLIKRPATLLKKSLWHRYFPVNFVKFLRTPFLTENLRWLFLNDRRKTCLLIFLFFRLSNSWCFKTLM